MTASCEHMWQTICAAVGWLDKEKDIQACVNCDELRWNPADPLRKSSPPIVYTRKVRP